MFSLCQFCPSSIQPTSLHVVECAEWVVATWNCQVQVWLEGRERCGLVITPACRATELKVN